ncbi:c-type cytochrome [Hydrogenophaga sp.]|uniref:c-type cytochrome n=1 Tax=Hydrogenophaga sp. TaxID=1904254 RepID=UPI003F6FFA02
MDTRSSPMPRTRNSPRGYSGLWLVLACFSLVACDGPPDRTPTLGDASAEAGLRLVTEKGCVACHTFPDVPWPRGGLGPSLQDFARQGLIAGQLPNQPGVLMQFVRNAPALKPGTAMPAITMTDQEARDVTAYLLTLQPR